MKKARYLKYKLRGYIIYNWVKKIQVLVISDISNIENIENMDQEKD